MKRSAFAAIAAALALAGCATTHSPAQGTFRGSYVYFADAALFTDCRTGTKLPVATEGDNLALERAYAAARKAPAEPVVVEVKGRVESRPPMEGPGTRPTLVVEKFLRVVPEGNCDRP